MKTFLVKDASLAFDKNSDSIKLHHPAKQDKDNVELFAGWAAYEASQLSMYINHCLNQDGKK